jgi:hypothetical protein
MKFNLITHTKKYEMRVVSVLQEGRKSAACGLNQSMRCLNGLLLWGEILTNQDVHIIGSYLCHSIFLFLQVNQGRHDYSTKRGLRSAG